MRVVHIVEVDLVARPRRARRRRVHRLLATQHRSIARRGHAPADVNLGLEAQAVDVHLVHRHVRGRRGG